MSKVEDVCEQSSVSQTYHRRGCEGEAPSHWVVFCNFLKKSYFDAIGSHFARVQSNLKELDI